MFDGWRTPDVSLRNDAISLSENGYGQFEVQARGGAVERPRLFVVFGNQRTGSTLVGSRLNSHPHIVCYEEVLLPGLSSGPSLENWLTTLHRPQWLKLWPSVRRSFLMSLSSGNLPISTEAVGVKIMYDQLSLWPKLAYMVPPAGRLLWDAGLLAWLRDNRILIIHTLRRNHLKVIVSHERAGQTGQFHHRQGAETSAHLPIVIPLQGLIARLRRIESAEKTARKAIQGLEVVEVWYEDYVGDHGPELENRICAALGQTLPVNGLKSPLKKITKDNLRDSVANYDEVASRLSGTRFERFLVDR